MRNFGEPASKAIAIGLAGALSAAAQTRYLDKVFANVTATPDIVYGSAIAHTGATETLRLDLYQPQGDTAKARPLFIWIHGGGFSGGSKDDGDVVYLCRNFAEKGYVTATIHYRLQSPLNTKEAMGAEVIRAVQDAKAAVRFLRSKKAEYRIDDTRIMMGGTSAGGVLSLDYAYLDRDEVPSYVDTAALGGFEGKSGTPGVSTAIHGIVNCWGGLGDSTVVQDGKLPVIHFHGTADPTVPYDIGYSLGNPAFTTFGSACLHRNLVRAGVTSVLKPFPGMGHGVPAGDPRADTLVDMSTSFAYDVLFKTPSALASTLAPAKAASLGASFTVDGRRLGSAARRMRPAVLRIDADGVLRIR
jgi:acetyl esterase/lipase